MSKCRLKEAIKTIKSKEAKWITVRFVEHAYKTVRGHSHGRWWSEIPLHMREYAIAELSEAFGWDLSDYRKGMGPEFEDLGKEDIERSVSNYIKWLKSPGEVKLDKEVKYRRGSREIAEKLGYNFEKLIFVVKCLNWIDIPKDGQIEIESNPVFSVKYSNGKLNYENGIVTIKDVNISSTTRMSLKNKPFHMVVNDSVLEDFKIRTVGEMSKKDGKQRFYTTCYGKVDSLCM